MTEHKYTDEDIIRALEHCVYTERGYKCRECVNVTGCKPWLLREVLDLINRQREEIAELRKERLCKVGDKLFIINEDEAGIVVEENKVTEVGERFIFFSGFAPPKDDILNNVEIADLGKEVFLDEAAFKQELERRRLEYDRGRGAGGI